MKEHITAIETALNDAESYVETLEDGPLKTAAAAALDEVHSVALAQYQAFVAAFPDEIAEEGVALRSGGHDKD